MGEYLRRAKVAGVSWPVPEAIDDAGLERRLFPALPSSHTSRPLPEWSEVRRKLTNRLRRAKLKHDACIKDIDFRHRRGLDKQLVLSLADGRWVREHLNVLICGPTGIGKSWIGCALAHSACRNGHSALYVRVSRLLSALAIARADGRYPKLLESLAKTEVLVMDDWGLAPFNAENRTEALGREPVAPADEGSPRGRRLVRLSPPARDRTENRCCRARGTDRNWTRVDRKMLWSPAASSSQQRARVLTDVKARRFAPPPLRGADGLDAGSAHARPDWLLPTMLTHTPPTCCGRRPVQNDALSGDR